MASSGRCSTLPDGARQEPPLRIRHNWLLQNVLERIRPNVRRDAHVPFRHTPRQEKAPGNTEWLVFTNEKPGGARTLRLEMHVVC